MPGERTLASFKAAAAKIRSVKNAVCDATFPRGVRRMGDEIMQDVLNTRPGAGVPRESNALANSGRVVGLRQVNISFGGPEAPYAMKQHEDLSYHHDDGEARYLVRGMERYQGNSNAIKQAFDAVLLPITRSRA